MTSATPLELDYTNRDYESIRNFLVSAARGFMPEWLTVGEPADFGTLLLELYAYMGDVLNYYIDRVAAEPFLATAMRRQSILGIADMLGYTPIAQQAAGGVVTFTLDASAYLDTDLVIPTSTVVQTLSGQSASAVYFETIGVVVLGQAIRTADIGVSEGRTVAFEYLALSNGAPLQEYVLTNQGAIHRTVVVNIMETDQGEIVWTYVDHLTDSDPDASVYTTYLDDQEFLHVVFGDNVAGRIPPTGAQITTRYRYGVGAEGNVTAGTIVQITKPIQGVSVVNSTGLNGGADNESIDAMRRSIPRASKLKGRAITLQDFADLALQVPGVAKATAIGEYYTQVKVYIAPVGGGYPTLDLRNRVETYIQERSLVGTTVEVHPFDNTDIIYTHVRVAITVHVLAQYGQLTVTNAVSEAITQLFSFDSMDFGILVSRGQVYHTCLNVPGVDWIELDTLQPLNDAGVPVGAAVQDIQAAPTRIPLSVPADITVTGEGGLS